MELILKRVALNDTYTIGKLYNGTTYLCDTLEDKVRDINKDGKLDTEKVYGETATPYSKYKVTITYSNRFKKDLPLLLNVPNFDGIRIHPGNTAIDTHGCILVGKNTVKGEVTTSKIYFEKVFNLIKEAFNNKEEITINII